MSYWHGAIQSHDDVDWYMVQLSGNRGYSFSVKPLFSSGASGTAQFKVKGLVGPDGTTRVGDTGDGRTSFSYFVPRGKGGTYFVGVAKRGQNEIGFYTIIAEEEDVPDNTGGPPLRVGETYASYIHHEGDQDWFRIELDSTRNYRIRANGGWGGNHLVKTLALKKPRDGTMNNMEVSSGYQAVDVSARLKGSTVHTAFKEAIFKPSASGTYYIVIGFAEEGSGAPNGKYYVIVEDTGPARRRPERLGKELGFSRQDTVERGSWFEPHPAASIRFYTLRFSHCAAQTLGGRLKKTHKRRHTR